MIYTLSEFMTTLKENIGIKDLPMPVDDAELLTRFKRSALAEFSQISPYILEVPLTHEMITDESKRYFNGAVIYTIPYAYYEGHDIVSVLGIDAGSYGGGSDNTYMPTISLGGADTILESVADIKMAAALGQMMCHAPTIQFFPPNKVAVYNGWYGGVYRIEIGITHDVSLSTIPPDAFIDLMQLAMLDTQEYLYNKLQRKDNLDIGVGNISLKIDEWANSKEDKKNLLEQWRETSSLSLDPILYW